MQPGEEVSRVAAEVEASLKTGNYVVVRGPGRLKLFNPICTSVAEAIERVELIEPDTRFDWNINPNDQGAFSQMFPTNYEGNYRYYIQRMKSHEEVEIENRASLE